MQDVRRDFGRALRIIRKWRGFSLDDLARKGLDKSYLSEVEGGKRNPSLRYIWKLSRSLGMGMMDLFWLLEMMGIREAPPKVVEKVLGAVELVVLLLKEEGREDLIEELFTRLGDLP